MFNRKKNKTEYIARHAVPSPEEMTTIVPDNDIPADSANEDSRVTTTEFTPVKSYSSGGTVVRSDETEETMPSLSHSWGRRPSSGSDDMAATRELPDDRKKHTEIQADEPTAEVVLGEENDSEKEDTHEILTEPEEESRESEEEKTQVLSLPDSEDEESDDSPTHGTQMMLEGFGPDAAEEPELTEEEKLRRARMEKIQDFSQRREQHEQEEAAQVVAPAEEAEEEANEADSESSEESALPDLMTPAVASARYRQQNKVLHRQITATVATAAIELVLLITAVTAASGLSIEPIAYLILQLLLFGLMLFTNRSWLLKDVGAWLKGTRLPEGAVAFSALVTAVHTVLQLVNTAGVATGSVPLLTAVSGFTILLTQLIRTVESARVAGDFSLLSQPGDKLVGKRITDSRLAVEIGRPAVSDVEPCVTYVRQTQVVADYDKTATDTERYRDFMKWYAPLIVGLAIAISAVFLVLNGLNTWLFATTVFCTVVAVAAPAPLLLATLLPLANADRKAHAEHTALTGYPAAEEFGKSHGIALDATDLFPERSVLLHAIKTFSNTRIDEAILDAASVSIRAGGPLSHVFRRMIQNKVDMLHEVDTLVYEQDMGLSGWINGRRILIGNRRLLDNHGIDIPSKDYEQRYAKNGRQLVYLSIAGELSAMFVVSYTADPEIRQMLETLTERRITLLIRTCDQNITEDLITAVFGIKGFYVEMLNAPAGRSYETLVSGTTEWETAGAVSTGGPQELLLTLARCRRLCGVRRIGEILQAVLGLLALVLVAIAVLAAGAMFPPLRAIEILAIGSLITALITLLFS